MRHAHVALATAEAQGKNEKSGSKGLTSVNMCGTSSLKVCQQTDQADEPDLKAQSHKQGDRSAASAMFNSVCSQKSTVRSTLTLIIEALLYKSIQV